MLVVLYCVPLESTTHEPEVLPVVNSIAVMTFGFPVVPPKVTVMVLLPVEVTTPFHISIVVVPAPEPLVVLVTLVQDVTPPPLMLLMVPLPLEGLENNTIMSFREVGATASVVTVLPLLVH